MLFEVGEIHLRSHSTNFDANNSMETTRSSEMPQNVVSQNSCGLSVDKSPRQKKGLTKKGECGELFGQQGGFVVCS